MALTEQQHAARSQGIGGSELAAIMGLSPFTTPFQVWLRKTGRIPKEQRVTTPAMEWGNRLEPAIADAYAELRRVKVRHWHRTFERGPLVAHIDRTVDGEPTILEAKVVHPLVFKDQWGEEGTDAAPQYYVTQAHHYLTVKPRYTRVDIAAYVSAMPLQLFPVDRDEELCDMIERQVREWWQTHVIGGKPPAAMNAADLRIMYARDNKQSAEASRDLLAKCAELADVKELIKQHEDKRTNLEIEIKAAIGESAELCHPDTGRAVATWKSQTSSRLNTKALAEAHPDIAAAFRYDSETRVFRLKPANISGETGS